MIKMKEVVEQLLSKKDELQKKIDHLKKMSSSSSYRKKNKKSKSEKVKKDRKNKKNNQKHIKINRKK